MARRLTLAAGVAAAVAWSAVVLAAPLVVEPPVRLCDAVGCGYYGAPRGDRAHAGVDLAAWPGSAVLVGVGGRVTGTGHVYEDDYAYVEVTDPWGRVHRYLYVEPAVRPGQTVADGGLVGYVQDLRDRYPGITPHVHYELRVDGRPVNPLTQEE